MDKPGPNGAISAMPPLKDPVCGMKVTEQPEHQAGHVEKRYYFCSAGCKAKFKADPEDYTTVNPVGAERKPVTTPTNVQLPASMAASTFTKLGQAGTTYTCPMHSEIRQDRPGNCPICGMTLEPLIPELGGGDNKELLDFQHRLLWTLPLTVVVTALTMVGRTLIRLFISIRAAAHRHEFKPRIF